MMGQSKKKVKLLEYMVLSALNHVDAEAHIDIKNRRAKIYKFKKEKRIG